MAQVERGDGDSNKKPPLNLDWSALLPDSDDPPPELIVRGRDDPAGVRLASDENVYAEVQELTDQKLDETIARHNNHIRNLGHRLPDGGAKIRGLLKSLNEEKDRRKLRWHDRRIHQDANRCMGISSPSSPVPVDKSPSDGFCEETSSPEKQSSFYRIFSKSMDENNVCRIGDADKAPLNFNHSDRHKKKSKRKLSTVDMSKSSSSSRSPPYRSPSQDSLGRKQHPLDSDHRGYSRLPCNSFYGGLRTHHKRKDDLHVRPFSFSNAKREVTVVLDDEEDCQLIDTTGQATKNAEWEDTKIYYPSRGDPDCVEIHCADLDCLKPEKYLTSPIMNFYILYLQLQASLSGRGISDYLFFNTYFYKKLQEAVSCKRDMRDASFTRLRRWWKGVNIFQKAYVLIPIHEELHWSLAIICIPDKVDGSGPILLHLDSLNFHQSTFIFHNIRRFLIEEWNHLKQEVAPSDLLIADEVWENLPRKISERKIMVPQQKNDYDCGLFVLYFMERFIGEAPERIRKNDLAMFGRQWFKSEEASNLRAKVRKLLVAELEKAKESCNSPVCSPQLEDSNCRESSPHLAHIPPSPGSEHSKPSPSHSGNRSSPQSKRNLSTPNSEHCHSQQLEVIED